MQKSAIRISPFVVERLTRYLIFMQLGGQRGKEWISSDTIAKAMGLTSSTVRQDISHLPTPCGISKKGYDVKRLAAALTDVLGIETVKQAVIVGAGNFGKALFLHEEFLEQGLRIAALFDNDPGLIGIMVGGARIRDVAELDGYAEKNGVDIGIIAVPAEAAQHVADQLVAAGVKGILNLSTCDVRPTGGVPVVHSRLILDILNLSFKMKYNQVNGKTFAVT
ncbi:MAG TPA: redox-sensing transcriptional repressor Rex [Spirochaetia bacterium]|nr:redox-sensing transcriptional repressor Rex [Spirochaetia bacterium]